MDKVDNAVLVCMQMLLTDVTVHTATKYISPVQVVHLSRIGRFSARQRSSHFHVKVGKPNYDEAKFVKLCQKAGEPFPVRKVQLSYYKGSGKRRHPHTAEALRVRGR